MPTATDRESVERRLQEIQRTDREEAGIISPNASGGQEIHRRLLPKSIHTANDLTAAVKAHLTQFCVDHEPRRFRNDITPGTAPGWPLDGSVLVEQVQFALANFSPIRRLATVHPLEHTLQATIPGINDTSIEATIIPPGSPLLTSDPRLSSANMKAVNFGIPRLNISRALLEDSPRLNSARVAIMAGRLARGQNRVFTVGSSGSGGPEGVLNSAAVGATTASPTAFTIAEIWNLVSSVPGVYRSMPNACFMMHSAIEAACMLLADGSGRPVWRAAGLDKWPIVPNDHMPSTIAASATPILFGDFSNFHIVDFGPIRFEDLYEPRAEFDEVVMQGFAYSDGELLDAGTMPIVKLQMNP